MLKDLRIRTRLYIAAALAIATLCALTAINAYSIRSGEQALSSVYRHQVVPMAALVAMDGDLKEIRFRMAAYLLDQMPVVGNKNHLTEAVSKIPADWERFKRGSRTAAWSEEDRALVAAIDAELVKAGGFFAKLDAAYAVDDRARIGVMLESDWPQVHAGLLKPLGKLLPVQEAAVERTYADSSAANGRLLTLAWTALAIAIAGAIVVARGLSNAVANPLRQAVQIANRIAGGDLTGATAVASRDECGQLLLALDRMRTGLRGIVAEVRSRSEHVASAANEIANGNIDLSHRTESQASSLEETTSAIEELTVSAKRNADNSTQARGHAEATAQMAANGRQAVVQV